MKKIEIIESFGRYKRGQVIEMDDFDLGHALAFKYGKIYAGKPVEVQMVIQPETRIAPSPVFEQKIEIKKPVEGIVKIDVDPKKSEKIEPKKEETGFFKRRGRRPKT